jgi:hypothetical protein
MPPPAFLKDIDRGRKRGETKMGWHVRYFDCDLKHEMMSREWATKEEALEDAWQLAQQEGKEVTAVEGPNEVLVPMEEIQAWFDKRIRPEDAGSSS